MRLLTVSEKKYLTSFFKQYQPEIMLVTVFGSHGTDAQRDDSDIDFGILFKDSIGLFEEMKILAHLSEILNYENVDLVNLNTAPITIQFNALGGEIIFEKDYILTSNYIERVLKIYGDYAPVLNKFDQEMLGKEITYHEF
jgi:predicted nucleotidyltransferase